MAKKVEEKELHDYKCIVIVERIDDASDFLKRCKESYLVNAISIGDTEVKLVDELAFGADGECTVESAVPELFQKPVLVFNPEGNAEKVEVIPTFEAKISRWHSYDDNGKPLAVKERYLVDAPTLELAEKVVKEQIKGYSNEEVKWKFRIHSVKEYVISGLIGYDHKDCSTYFCLQDKVMLITKTEPVKAKK